MYVYLYFNIYAYIHIYIYEHIRIRMTTGLVSNGTGFAAAPPAATGAEQPECKQN
jgi:hypothetical protein